MHLTNTDCIKRQTAACIALYAGGTSCTIYSLTHPSVLLMWLMDKLQRSDTWRLSYWVPGSALLRSSGRISASNMPLQLSCALLPSAVCSENCSLIRSATCQLASTCIIWDTLKYYCLVPARKTQLHTISLWLWSCHDKTLERDKYTHTNNNGRQPKNVILKKQQSENE